MRFIIDYVICLYWRILSEHGQNATGRYACLQYPPRPLYDTLHRVANSCASPGERRSRDVQQCYKLTEYLTVRFDMGALLAITIDAIDVIEFWMNSFLQLPPRVKSTLCDLQHELVGVLVYIGLQSSDHGVIKDSHVKINQSISLFASKYSYMNIMYGTSPEKHRV